jgi:hypothetical protein
MESVPVAEAPTPRNEPPIAIASVPLAFDPVPLKLPPRARLPFPDAYGALPVDPVVFPEPMAIALDAADDAK